VAFASSKLYRPSARRLSAKLVPTFADRGRRVISATDSHGCVLGILDRSRYYFFQVAPQLYSRDWVDPVPDPVLLRKSGSAGNRTQDLRICSQELWPLDDRGGTHTCLKLHVSEFLSHVYICFEMQGVFEWFFEMYVEVRFTDPHQINILEWLKASTEPQ
jgi:hypothetical protein